MNFPFTIFFLAYSI